jgi:catechol 2,3-dioxygenase-like lactoylglutathione lyase family enzyme
VKLVEIAYFTDNVAEMARYYRHLLGAEPVAQSDGMAIFLVGETKLFIHRAYEPEANELPPENHVAFAVADVDAACRALISSGLQLEVAPQDYYWGRSTYLRDPDGHLIELTQSP